MGIQWVSGLHLIFLTIFFVATAYTCLGAQNSTLGCHKQERLALLEFKHSAKDDFKMLSSWVGVDCCSWKGVLCDAATRFVTNLQLRGNYEENYYLVGEKKLNAYLAELRHLKLLDLSGNSFEGIRIPEFIGSFKQLNYLNLSQASFYGIIPHHIGNLSNLKVLDLSRNSVYVWNPVDAWSSVLLKSNDMSWVSGLSSLEHLDLSEVDLSQAKNIDMVLYMIPSLTYLNLGSCRLSNTDLGHHLNSSKILPHLEHLDLSYNLFEGQLPHFFQNMTSLTFLDLSYYNLSLAWNSLTLLNMISSLSELHLSICGLHNAHFSPTNFNFSVHSKIQYLDLSWNSIEGIFPYELMNMTFVRVLDLSGNRLNSSIPVMPNLQILAVSHNNFENIELVGIWRQCHLKELSLSWSNFGKEMIGVSTNISRCSRYALEMLDLGHSNLNGSIPESLKRLTNLRILNLWGNKLTGSIPKALSRLRSLEVLDLSDNDLTGPISTFLGKLTKLDLSGNQYRGPIPKSIGRLTSLTELKLQSNQLTGPIPTWLGSLASLVRLDVSKNSLEGMVSETHFAKLSMLKYLDTTDNKLIFNISHEWIPPFQLFNFRIGFCKIPNGFPQWLQNSERA